MLAGALSALREAVADHAWSVEGTWFSTVLTTSGTRMASHKALAFEALTHADRFIEELSAFSVTELGAVDASERSEMLAFLRHTWIEPTVEPSGPSCTFEYKRDWVRFLEADAGGEPIRQPIKVEYAWPREWLDRGYTKQNWTELALIAHRHYAHAFCHKPVARRVSGELLAFDSFGDEACG